MLSKSEALSYYGECFEALQWGITELENYLKENKNFTIGKIMLESWKMSLEEKNMKEVDDDTIRTWRDY